MIKFTIKQIKARQILDSRGNPTVEADVTLNNGFWGRAAVPSGASTGSKEALELRDNTKDWMGKSVFQAIDNIHSLIAPAVLNKQFTSQAELDQTMIELDGTKTKSKLGANAILAVSLAAAKAVANQENLLFYQYIGKLAGNNQFSIPMPMMNVINGGSHAGWSTDFQEYMIIPSSAKDITEALKIGSEVFHNLKKVLKDKDYSITVGDEGGFAPRVKAGNQEPLDLIAEAIKQAGYQPGQDVKLALDVAASEFFNQDYQLKADQKKLSTTELAGLYRELAIKYPIVSIEDGLDENDWSGWSELNKDLGKSIQLVGDDLLVTNSELLQQAIDKQSCNAILIKLNQIGTLTETIETVKLAQANKIKTIISHRSGETEDTAIAHLAVGLNAGQIKTGSLSRTDRICKYNELIRISEQNPELSLSNCFTI